jgi:acyl-coenzyme A thioesterase PaaI-like protein
LPNGISDLADAQLDTPAFDSSPDPDNPGWLKWQMTDPSRYNGTVLGKMLVRSEGDGKARLRMFPGHVHSNLSNAIHGGVTLGFIDVAMFGASRMFGLIEAGTAVTLDLSVQFIGAGVVGEPLDAEVELLKETGRLLFMRGLVLQGENRVAAFSGTIRKPSKR